MEIVSRDPKHPMGIIPRALAIIDEIIESHNKSLREMTQGFDLFSMGLAKHQFERLEEFLLKGDYDVDQAAVEKKVAGVEEEAR
ncbi:MAG: hypothetical protein UY21_C0009G0023 [Microgenomates group bacterium GW2011_GWA1_48_10]|nr:MAG: hypothetical protein UY21_C0009G0023 [Microgenomates group bacterium GW2011_GWA1_48_10]